MSTFIWWWSSFFVTVKALSALGRYAQFWLNIFGWSFGCTVLISARSFHICVYRSIGPVFFYKETFVSFLFGTVSLLVAPNIGPLYTKSDSTSNWTRVRPAHIRNTRYKYMQSIAATGNTCSTLLGQPNNVYAIGQADSRFSFKLNLTSCKDGDCHMCTSTHMYSITVVNTAKL